MAVTKVLMSRLELCSFCLGVPKPEASISVVLLHLSQTFQHCRLVLMVRGESRKCKKVNLAEGLVISEFGRQRQGCIVRLYLKRHKLK